MFSKKNCFVSSLVVIFFTMIISMCPWPDVSAVVAERIGILCNMLLLVIFPIALYWIYLNSTLNKWIGYFLALLTSIVSFATNVFLLNIDTNFSRLREIDLGIALTIWFVFVFHLAIGLFCGIIYFIKWIRNRI